MQEKQRKVIRASTCLLAASIACTNASLAYPQDLNNVGPADILPLIFTPLVDPQNLPSRNRPEPKEDTSYAEADLDLAIDNFFYALDDLIQSANRHAAVETKEVNGAVALSMPATVIKNDDISTPRVYLPPTTAKTSSVSNNIFDNFSLSSQLGVSVTHNDNIYTTREQPVADQIAGFNGDFSLETKTRKSSLKFDAGVVMGSYLENSDDNYVDLRTNATYTSLLSLRSKVIAGIAYSANHEERGAGSTEEGDPLSLGRPVEFDSTVARAVYEKGTNQTRARATADISRTWIDTTNFQDIEAITQRDRKVDSILGSVFYNFSQRMAMLVELRYQDVNYDDTRTGLTANSDQTRFAVGAEWLATKKTAGSVRVGIQEKDFDSDAVNDFSGASWDAIIEWTPAPRTEMIFETASDVTESEGFGISRESMNYKITWKQRWSPRLSSNSSTQYSQVDYQQDPREDELTLLNAELSYSLGTNSDAKIKMTYIDNQSNIKEFSFDRTLIQLGLDIEL